MYRYTRFAVFFALAASCIVSSSAVAEPMTPIVADWAVANAGEINERMRKRIKEYLTDGGELSRLADLDASDVRLYHRDNQLLMAISVKRNLTYGVKAQGEKTAARLALGVLQQINTIPINDKLDEDAVRVVFIEPTAQDPYSSGGPCGTRGCGGSTGQWHRGVGSCDAQGPAFGASPIPFAAAGHWSAGWASGSASCGCQ